MTPIGSNSVLPAKRSDFSVTAADGVRLSGELALPDWTDPVATLVCVHPLTTEGGSMESHLYRKMSWRLPALAGLAVVRFNLRGAGTGERRSGGEFDACQAEGWIWERSFRGSDSRNCPIRGSSVGHSAPTWC